MRSNFPETLV